LTKFFELSILKFIGVNIMEKKIYRAPAIERAARVMENLARGGGDLTLSEIARALGVGKSSALGILRALEGVGWVERLGDAYRTGSGFLHLSGGRQLEATARPFMEELAEKFGNTVCVGRFTGDRLVIEGCVEGRGSLTIALKPGLALPLFAAATGKAYLSLLDDQAARGLLASNSLPAYTERSITDGAAFMGAIEKCRLRGWADDDEEYLRGVRAVASPIARGGRPWGALWIVGFAASMPSDKAEEMGALLSRTSLLIPRLLNWT